MIRFLAVGLIMLAAGNAAFAHFVFIVPAVGSDALNVVMSESLEPDEAVKLGPVAELHLFGRALDGKDTPITLKPSEHQLTGNSPSRRVAFGSLDYGVTARGGQSFLLKYHPKAVIGSVPSERLRLGKQPAEIVGETTKDGLRFCVLAADAPATKVDVTVLLPDGTSKKVTTDGEGRTPVFAASGRYGAWARVTENVAGELNGQKYSQIRHYPTLVIDHSAYPPLPEAVSSFGAVVADGWVYAYGGHRAKVHTYDTKAVTGGWRRLNLAQPKEWEELPQGEPLQGMALVNYQGKCIRTGGMAPHNAAGEKADTRSTGSCAIYDPAKKAWLPFPSLPKPRSSHDAVVVGDTMYLAGGWNMLGTEGNDWCEDGLYIDLKNPESGWKSMPQPFHRRALQAGVFQDRIYFVGGLTEDNSITGEVSIFDPVRKTWSTGPELPGGDKYGFNPGICTVNGRLYVGVANGVIARLSADGSKWEQVGKLAPRVVHRMVPAGNNMLLVLGGASAGENLDTVEAVKLSD